MSQILGPSHLPLHKHSFSDMIPHFECQAKFKISCTVGERFEATHSWTRVDADTRLRKKDKSLAQRDLLGSRVLEIFVTEILSVSAQVHPMYYEGTSLEFGVELNHTT